MRYLAVFLAWVACWLPCAAQADQWKQVREYKAPLEIKWLDVSRHGDQVVFVTVSDDPSNLRKGKAYLGTVAKKGEPVRLKPPQADEGLAYTGYISRAIFYAGKEDGAKGDQKQVEKLAAYSSADKYNVTKDGRVVPAKLSNFEHDFLHGVVDRAFVKSADGRVVVMYWQSRPADAGKHFPKEMWDAANGFHIMNVNRVDHSFYHRVGGKVQEAAISSDGAWVFTADDTAVKKWSTTMGAIGQKKTVNQEGGSFDLNPDYGRTMEIVSAAKGQVVVAASAFGAVSYSEHMSKPRPLVPGDGQPARADHPLLNHSVAVSEDVHYIFVARRNKTDPAHPVEEVVWIKSDGTVVPVFTRTYGEPPIIKLKMVGTDTLAMLDANGELGLFPLLSGGEKAVGEGKWLQTTVLDPSDLLLSGDDTTLVVRGSQTISVCRSEADKSEKAVADKKVAGK